MKEVISYDDKAQLSKVVYSGQVARTDAYTYNGTYIDYVTKVTTGNFTIIPEQDIDERYTGKSVVVNGTTVDAEAVWYLKENDHSTRLPKDIFYYGTYISYTYDGNGNIKTIIQNGELQAQYTYDTLGRLIREDNKTFGSYFYTYDNNGNIKAKEYCAFTTGSHTLGTGTVTSYTYNKDKMTKFGGESCTYDDVGNPTIYRGKSATWTRGRKLISYNGTAFSYDAQGRRISKNGITYIYDSNGRLLKQTNGLEFFYDTTGLVGLTYGGKTYVYRKDVQGNIIAILDSDCNIVVQYKYDAWGNHIVSGSNPTLGNLNPFRYRSYYYDTETKLYFLQTRYYDPEVGRFINMDSLDYADPESINGLNLYAYCNNNPVMNVDPTGTWNWCAFWKGVGMLVTAVTAIALAVTTFGAGIPLAMTIVAGVTLAAGVLTGINGVATVIEAGTDYNFVRDGVFQGNETAYNWYAGISESVAAVGSMVLGCYQSTGQFKAAKQGRAFLGKGAKKSGPGRWVSSDKFRQIRLDGNHFNMEYMLYGIEKGVRNTTILNYHVYFNALRVTDIVLGGKWWFLF